MRKGSLSQSPWLEYTNVLVPPEFSLKFIHLANVRWNLPWPTQIHSAVGGQDLSVKLLAGRRDKSSSGIVQRGEKILQSLGQTVSP